MTLTPDQALKLATSPVVAGNRLGRAIDIAGVAQTALATAIGLPNSYVSDVAHGRYRTITVANAHRFAAYFGVPIEILFPARDNSEAA